MYFSFCWIDFHTRTRHHLLLRHTFAFPQDSQCSNWKIYNTNKRISISAGWKTRDKCVKSVTVHTHTLHNSVKLR